jgi:hypothetical protein
LQNELAADRQRRIADMHIQRQRGLESVAIEFEAEFRQGQALLDKSDRLLKKAASFKVKMRDVVQMLAVSFQLGQLVYVSSEKESNSQKVRKCRSKKSLTPRLMCDLKSPHISTNQHNAISTTLVGLVATTHK